MNIGVGTLNYIAPADFVPSTASGVNLAPRIEVSWAASNGTSENIDSPFNPHFSKLMRLMKDRSLWQDGAEAPGPIAQEWALIALAQLQSDQFLPSRVVASAEGGVAICFSKGNKYADIEFLNSGEILGVVSNRRDRPVAWEIAATPSDLARASVRIRHFFEAPEAAPNVPTSARFGRSVPTATLPISSM
jgi:hypothetical protein